jgi:hypothetical protein
MAIPVLPFTHSFKHPATEKDKKTAKRLILLPPSVDDPYGYGVLLLRQSKLKPDEKKPKHVTRKP